MEDSLQRGCLLPLCCLQVLAAAAPSMLVGMSRYAILLEHLLALACQPCSSQCRADTGRQPSAALASASSQRTDLHPQAVSVLNALALHSLDARAAFLEQLLPWALSCTELSEVRCSTIAVHDRVLQCSNHVSNLPPGRAKTEPGAPDEDSLLMLSTRKRAFTSLEEDLAHVSKLRRVAQMRLCAL